MLGSNEEPYFIQICVVMNPEHYKDVELYS